MRGAVGACLLLLVLMPAVGAQAPPSAAGCRPPVLYVQEAPGPFEPGGSYPLLYAIENPNGPPVDVVRATVTTIAPAGWSATPAQREVTLSPKNVNPDVLVITAPNRGSGQAGGNITLVVTFVCTSGDIQTSASAQRSIEVRISEFRAPWPLVLGAFVVMAAGITALGLRRVRRGVDVVVEHPERPVEPGKSAKFTFAVENRRGKPQRFHLLAAGVPEGWSIHLALPEVELEPGEEKTLWAIVKAPPGAMPGDVAVVEVRLESPRGGREGAVAVLRARVAERP